MITETRQRWLISSLGAALMVAGVGSLFRLPTAFPPLPAVQPKVQVEVVQGDDLNAALSDEARMRDPTPLFLPTDKTAARKPLPSIQPGRTSFLDEEVAKPFFKETVLDVGLPSPATAPLTAPEALATNSTGPIALGFGRVDVAVVPIKPRGGVIEVVALSSGQTIFTEELPVTARPAASASWQPMEFFATAGTTGLSSPLIVNRRSGVEGVDVHFQNYLTQTYRIGERLAPGLYRIYVGP